MKRSQETFRTLLEAVAEDPSFANAARRAGISRSLFWEWVRRSQRGDPEYVVWEFCGERDVPLHEALQASRKMTIHAVVENMERRALLGDSEPVYFQGRPQWREREDLAGLDDETVRLLGFPDRWERDANGNRVQLTIKRPPPVALALAVAAAHFPQLYGAKSEQTVNINGAGGVQRVATSYSQPKPLPPPPLQVEPQPDWYDAADDLADLLGEEPPQPAEPVQPEPVARTAQPVEPPPQPEPQEMASQSARQLSDQERDLFARLKNRPTMKSA